MSRLPTPTRTLPSGDELPVIGLGTWLLHGDELRDAVTAAFEAGYRHFDTAEAYGNEADLGNALASYDREDFFLTSKVAPPHLSYEGVIRACQATLERLGTEYLDCYLIHFPNPAISLRETLSAMATLHDDGLVRNVGVSNFDAYRLSCAQHITDVPIAVNQLEFHPLYQQQRTVAFCQEHDIVVEGAAPLGRGQVFDDASIEAIADRHDRSPAQVVLKWALEREVVPLPRSGSPAHIADNIDLFSWELDDAAVETLDEHPVTSPAYSMPTGHWSDETYGVAP